MFSGIADENAGNGARSELVGGLGCDVGEAKATVDAKMVVTWRDMK